MEMNIDLGSKPAIDCYMPEKSPEPEKYYPGVYLHLPPGTILPPKGEICFRYRVSSLKAESRKGGPVEVCADLELLALVEVEGGAGEETPDIPDVNTALAAFAAQARGK